MAPEYGATVGFFPIDDESLEYLRFTGRSEETIERVRRYCIEQGLFRQNGAPAPRFTDTLSLNLGEVVPSIAGPKRPQDRIALTDAKQSWNRTLAAVAGEDAGYEPVEVTTDRGTFGLKNGDVIIAAITSCTNTSNPAVLVAAGLLAKNARARGLTVPPYVKTSLAPGSQVVSDYLNAANLMDDLEALGFFLVGYGCTTCIGNSGPVHENIAAAIKEHKLAVNAVLSGNRNFEGRVSPHTRGNYLASPPLVVAYALAGTLNIDFDSEPIGTGSDGKPVFLRDIWPKTSDITAAVRNALRKEMFEERYGHALDGDDTWRNLPVPAGNTYAWDEASTYIRRPSFFDGITPAVEKMGDIKKARVLALLGDSVTTDHISPAGSIAKDGPAAKYLTEHGVAVKDFNSYGSRRGNHEVMMRGTFANIRLRNRLAPGTEGSFTRHLPDGEQTTIYDASMQYQKDGVPLIVIAGKEYGTGSSRDWAAKGTLLLGVSAVIAEGYERIHRSNLIGMGILPLEFEQGQSATSLGLTGEEQYTIEGLSDGISPHKKLTVSADGKSFTVVARLDTPQEVEYLENGGILRYVLRTKAQS